MILSFLLVWAESCPHSCRTGLDSSMSPGLCSQEQGHEHLTATSLSRPVELVSLSRDHGRCAEGRSRAPCEGLRPP